jgi:hypothetical protein
MRKLGGQVAAGVQEIHDDHFVIGFQENDEVLSCSGKAEVLLDAINQYRAALMLGCAIGNLFTA